VNGMCPFGGAGPDDWDRDGGRSPILNAYFCAVRVLPIAWILAAHSDVVLFGR